MTPQEIRDAVAASPALAALAQARNDAAIAVALSAGRTKLVPTEAGRGDVILALGFEVGNALLDHLKATPLFRHVWPLVDRGTLRLDLPLTIAMLDGLVGVTLDDGGDGVVFLQSHRAALLALASAPDPVPVDAVSGALNEA